MHILCKMMAHDWQQVATITRSVAADGTASVENTYECTRCNMRKIEIKKTAEGENNDSVFRSYAV